uniref:Uncharacterized protein n=1 Tax=Arundo donax TaxID=35708 RepID=A0A0A9B0H0_ARUDO
MERELNTFPKTDLRLSN